MGSSRDLEAKQRKRLKIVSATAGLFLLAIGIWLDRSFPDRPTAVQISVWTITVFTFIALANYRQRRERWFWTAMIAVIVVHVATVSNFRGRLPFYDLGVVILLSGVETILLQAVVIAVSRCFLVSRTNGICLR